MAKLSRTSKTRRLTTVGRRDLDGLFVVMDDMSSIGISAERHTEQGIKSLSDFLKMKRDEVLEKLRDNKTYLVKDEHTLEWMRGVGRVSRKGWKNRIPSGKIHPYSKDKPWYQELHDGGDQIHIQNSGRTGQTGRGVSLFARIVNKDYEGKSRAIYSIVFGDSSTAEYWKYLVEGTSTMVKRPLNLQIRKDATKNIREEMKLFLAKRYISAQERGWSTHASRVLDVLTHGL